MKREKFRWWKAFKKGILPAVGAYAATQVANYNLGEVLSNPQEQLPNIGVSLLVGLLPAVINTWKNRDKEGNPFYQPPSYLPLVLAVLALGGMAQGCITTTHPDQTVVQELDKDLIWAAYQGIKDLRAELRDERRTADAAEQARIDARLRVLDQAMRDTFQRWLDAGGKLPTITLE